MRPFKQQSVLFPPGRLGASPADSPQTSGALSSASLAASPAASPTAAPQSSGPRGGPLEASDSLAGLRSLDSQSAAAALSAAVALSSGSVSSAVSAQPETPAASTPVGEQEGVRSGVPIEGSCLDRLQSLIEAQHTESEALSSVLWSCLEKARSCIARRSFSAMMREGIKGQNSALEDLLGVAGSAADRTGEMTRRLDELQSAVQSAERSAEQSAKAPAAEIAREPSAEIQEERAAIAAPRESPTINAPPAGDAAIERISEELSALAQARRDLEEEKRKFAAEQDQLLEKVHELTLTIEAMKEEVAQQYQNERDARLTEREVRLSAPPEPPPRLANEFVAPVPAAAVPAVPVPVASRAAPADDELRAAELRSAAELREAVLQARQQAAEQVQSIVRQLVYLQQQHESGSSSPCETAREDVHRFIRVSRSNRRNCWQALTSGNCRQSYRTRNPCAGQLCAYLCGVPPRHEGQPDCRFCGNVGDDAPLL